MVVVVIHQGSAFRFPRADLAGEPFASHLPGQLLAKAKGGIVVVDTINPFAGQPDSLDARLVAGQDLLLVAADAWFSAAALEKLCLLSIAMSRRVNLVWFLKIVWA